MFRPRIIPVLLLKGKGLVKTVKFKNPVYVGDPINAVRIFNDLEADELIFLDITASKEKRTVSYETIKNIADEAFMPFAVGGGINRLEHVENLIKSGAEKVVINTATITNPALIRQSADVFGSQSIVVSVDVRKTFLGKYRLMIFSGTKAIDRPLEKHLAEIENLGAGEIVINSIDNDGLMKGYDIDLLKRASRAVSIPVIACGGAGKLGDLRAAYDQGEVSAVAAGSMFVFHGSRRAVLVNYPSKKEITDLFKGGGYA